MLVKIVLFLGIALVALAGGAAGYQALKDQGYDIAAYFGGGDDAPAEGAPAPDAPDGVTPTAAADAPPPAPQQDWLITPGGGLVEKEVVQAYLWQDRLVASRTMDLIVTVELSSLLNPGEQLPGAAFHAAFAEVRGHKAAEAQCAALQHSVVERCEMVSVHALADSVSLNGPSVTYQMTLAYTVNAERPLPDLSTVVLHEDRLALEASDAVEITGAVLTPEVVSLMVDGIARGCRNDRTKGDDCRILSVVMSEESKGIRMTASVARLGPLPAGLYPAPPLN